MKVIRFRFDNDVLKKHARYIRTTVFIEEQNVEEELEYDEFDQIVQHYLLMKDEQPIATARWRETRKGIKLERFAMLKEYRNRGLGSILLDEVLKDVVPLDKPIYLHAQLAAVNYYARKGFNPYGCHFFEADIEHTAMMYKGAIGRTCN